MTSKTKTTFTYNKKLDKIYHPETKLVIKSKSDRTVVGRIDGDSFIPLDEDDDASNTIELCEANGFKYDETLVDVQAEDDEEPKVVNANPKQSSKSEDEESVKQTPVKPALEQPRPKLDDLAIALAKHTKEMLDFVSKLQTVSQSNPSLEKDLVSVRKELDETRKELETVKKKLKTVLASMQDEL